MEFDLIGAMNRVRQLNTKLCAGVAMEYGLSNLEIEILLFLHVNQERNTASEFAQFRGVAKSNTSKAVLDLVTKELVSEHADPKNRRKKRLMLSKKSAEIADRIMECELSFVKQVLGGFSQEETALLVHFFRRIDDNVQTALRDLQER